MSQQGGLSPEQERELRQRLAGLSVLAADWGSATTNLDKSRISNDVTSEIDHIIDRASSLLAAAQQDAERLIVSVGEWIDAARAPLHRDARRAMMRDDPAAVIMLAQQRAARGGPEGGTEG